MNPARDKRAGTCRYTGCGRAVLWVRTELGASMPLDPVPDGERGTVILVGEQRRARVFGTAKEARAYQFLHEGEGPYVAHWGTCKGKRPPKRRPRPERIARPEPAEPDPQLTLEVDRA